MADIVADAAKLVRASYVGISLITAERLRQIAVEGFTPEHDAQHAHGVLGAAGAAYALHAAGMVSDARDSWPFGDGFKPGPTHLDSLVKAGALIAAEIDRIVAEEADRVAAADQQQEG